eukprot:163288-Prorocentrum_minimum.AAC.2
MEALVPSRFVVRVTRLSVSNFTLLEPLRFQQHENEGVRNAASWRVTSPAGGQAGGDTRRGEALRCAQRIDRPAQACVLNEMQDGQPA